MVYRIKEPRTGPVRRGEEHNRSKLTEMDVRVIRIWPKVYGYRTVVSRMFGITPQTVTAIRSGRSWAWLDREGKNRD
jgi:hypothetical protein